jgi:hypothetical protein
MQLQTILALGITVIFAGGCASDYSPRADLSSVQTIGVVVPPGSSEPQDAVNVIQLYNRTAGEDRLKNSAVGAGSGAAAGTAIGLGTAGLAGCALTGPWAPVCWVIFGGGGAILGGGTGAIAGATVDTQEQVEAAPVHLYEVNKVLPGIQGEYLNNAGLEQRALRLVNRNIAGINFTPAEPDGKRYRLIASGVTETTYSDVNLVLSDLRAQLEGKAENEPKVALSIYARWSLTKYDPATNANAEWDILEGNYKSEKFQLSEWLAEDGALLNSHIDIGLESSFSSAFAALAPETEEEKWSRISPEDSF